MIRRLLTLLLLSFAAFAAAPGAVQAKDKSKEAALIESECGLKKGTITAIGDQIRLQPSPDEGYKNVDCAIGRLNKADLGKLGFVGNEAATEASAQTLAPSAQIGEPASPSKQRLIRRYLQLIGRQDQLDTGSFLERYAIPGGPMWQVSNGQVLTESLKDGFDKRMAALRKAYAKHRATYQQAYEGHVNWEFTEAELAEIVTFLDRPVGKHFLDGRWRMEAYVGTDTEELEEQIVKEAMASLAK